MKKIKDFIYNNKKYILIFILFTIFNICMASCNLPKAKAATPITSLNDLWGKSWKINNNVDFYYSSNFKLYINANNPEAEDSDNLSFGSLEYRGTEYQLLMSGALADGQNVPFIEVNMPLFSGSIYLQIYSRYTSSYHRITTKDIASGSATSGQLLNSDTNSLIINFDEYSYFNIVGNTSGDYNEEFYINWWNENFTEALPPTQTNNLNIYVNDILAYNDNIEFESDITPSINYLYSNYTTNQLDFINNLAKPLKYTANEFIANVFNASNDNTKGSSIDFAFTGSYLVGISYDYVNIYGDLITNSYGLSPDDEDSIRILILTDLQRNDTDINIRITTNNLDDFESGAVNSAFKTIFGFFNEIINIQFGFITIGQILGFILAIAIIGLIYKVWNGGNND